MAMIAHDIGWQVFGSDISVSPMTDELTKLNAQFNIGVQDGTYLKQVNQTQKIDYFVYSSAIKEGHPELELAKELNIKCIKRDDLINLILDRQNLKMLAVAGTHGKTTTTAMVAWLLTQFNEPISYSIGSTINFGNSGSWQSGSEYFIYEADEYDRNFLNFNPYLSLITNVDYDHPDIYPTQEDYVIAFKQFESRSKFIILPVNEKDIIPGIKLNGLHNRKNATAAILAVQKIYPELELRSLLEIINDFPGTGRRMERIADKIYSDYAHTPEELKSSMQMLSEMFDQENIIAVYQPHQNARQVEIIEDGGYGESLSLASKIYWLPTYLTRENQTEALQPAQLMASLSNSGLAESAQMNDELITKLKVEHSLGSVIVFFGAGDIDAWARENLNKLI